MNTHEEVWETIQNEVAYLNGGSLAEQAANILTPFVTALFPGRTVEAVKAEAWDEAADWATTHPAESSRWKLDNPYRGESR